MLRAEVNPTSYDIFIPDELEKARRMQSKCIKCSKAAASYLFKKSAARLSDLKVE